MKVPPTLWPAPDADWRLPADLIEMIQRAITLPMPTDLSKLQRHDLVQRRLAQLGRDRGHDARIEVGTGFRARVQQGRFDVVWFAPMSQKSIVFEIDSQWRCKSIAKLGRVPDSQLRLWIYYGSKTIPADPGEPGLRKLNILRIDPALLGLPSPQRIGRLEAGVWPEALYPRRADHSARGARPGMVV